MKIVRTAGFLFIVITLLSSCEKGYEVRFTNYYTEPIDSVIIGNNKVVFTNIDREGTTGYSKISKGKYGVICISKTKKKFYSDIFISSHGSGRRTIQIDGISQISILED